MLSPIRIARNYTAALMKKTPYGNPEEKSQTPEDIKEKTKEIKEKSKALKELEKAQKDLDKKIKDLPIKIAQEDPNDDPQELFRQALPTLRRMGLNNMVDRNRTQLVVGQKKRDDSLYHIILRRNAEISEDTISRIYRNLDNFNVMKWSPRALEVYVWAPYNPPEVPGVETAPEAP